MLMARSGKCGLDDRSRDKDGQIREKRGDTQVGTLRETYGKEFLRQFRSDARLDTVRRETGRSLSEPVRDQE